jgi:hypothetical protein
LILSGRKIRGVVEGDSIICLSHALLSFVKEGSLDKLIVTYYGFQRHQLAKLEDMENGRSNLF